VSFFEKRAETKVRVLIGTSEISGLASGICLALNTVGVHAQTAFRVSHSYSYDEGIKSTRVTHIWRYFGDRAERYVFADQRLRAFWFRVLAFAWSFVVLGWSIIHYNSYLFLYGTCITNTKLELILLRLLSKKVVFFFVGSDSRPSFLDGGLVRDVKDVRSEFFLRQQLKKRRIVDRCEKYSDFCIASPYSAHFHSRSFVRCFSLGIPKYTIERPKHLKEPDTNSGRPLRVLHAPSDSGAKGSLLIAKAVKELQAEGVPLEFVQISGVPNATVIEEISLCDFVVDQVYSDTPMAALATEAALFGKPSVLAGYAALGVSRFISPEDCPPTLFVEPSLLRDAIRKMATDHDFRLRMGNDAKDFVTNRWSLAEIGNRYKQLFSGAIPDTWWFNPENVEYVHGYGLSEKKLSEIIEGIVTAHGEDGLCLNDKPVLKQKYLKLIGR
jgi:hypothetical protein